MKPVNNYKVTVNDEFWGTRIAFDESDAIYQVEQQIKRLAHVNEDYKKYIGATVEAKQVHTKK